MSFSARLLGREISPRARWTADRELDLRDRIQALIDERGLNQSNVAEKLGVGRSVVSEWLGGKRVITLKTLARFEKAFEVQLWDVVRRERVVRVAFSSEDQRRFASITDDEPATEFGASHFNGHALKAQGA